MVVWPNHFDIVPKQHVKMLVVVLHPSHISFGHSLSKIPLSKNTQHQHKQIKCLDLSYLATSVAREAQTDWTGNGCKQEARLVVMYLLVEVTLVLFHLTPRGSSSHE